LLKNRAALLERLYNFSDGEITELLGIPIHFGDLWGDIVSDYALLNLTFERDTLPALSGIASLMFNYHPGQYFGGIWQRDIHYLLGWSSASSVGRSYRPRNYTAPTFSWASRIGPVHFPLMAIITSVCTILDVSCTSRGNDPFGQVEGGYIVLQGRLISGITRASSWKTMPWELVTIDEQGSEHNSTLEFDTEEEAFLRHEDAEGKVYVFELFRALNCRKVTDEYSESYPCGLVLREANTPNTFRRVGIVQRGISVSAFDEVSNVTITII
jgi:hypothetical protein